MSNWTEGDHMSPEQEVEAWAREECKRRDIDPDEICADGGVEAWMVIAKESRALTGFDFQRALAECRGDEYRFHSLIISKAV